MTHATPHPSPHLQGQHAVFVGTVQAAHVGVGSGADGLHTVPVLVLDIEAPSVIHPRVRAHVPFDTHSAAEQACARYQRGAQVQFDAALHGWLLCVPCAGNVQLLTSVEAAATAARLEPDLFESA